MTNSKNSKAIFGIFAMVFVFFVILISFFVMTMNAFNDTSVDLMKNNKAKIGVITIEGPIMASRDIIQLLQTAEEDKNLEAIIVRIDSPGGTVGPTQEIFEEIIRIDTTTKKAVYASFGSIAASGGYYIGAATRRIWANPGTLTGSIGVIMQFMDLSKLYEFAKVSPQTVKGGKYKDIGNPARGMTQEESDLMQGMITNVHKQFMNDILKRRADRIKGDLTEHAQGQIFSGEEAYTRGLVDELGGLWQAGRAIHKELGIKEEFALKFIEKKKKRGFVDYLGSIDEAISNFNLESLVQFGEHPRIMFK